MKYGFGAVFRAHFNDAVVRVREFAVVRVRELLEVNPDQRLLFVIQDGEVESDRYILLTRIRIADLTICDC